MKLQEALLQAMHAPLLSIEDVRVFRESDTLPAKIFFGTDDNRELAIGSDSGLGSVILSLDDILAEDWTWEIYKKELGHGPVV